MTERTRKPHQNRARNAYQIGVVYGQRSQLNWDTLAYLLPYAFIAYYLTLHFFQVEVESLPRAFAYLSPVVALVSTVIAVAFGSFGLRHYQSTGT